MKNYLVHYGIKGQQWGTRRWQYEDGSYTPAEKKKNNKIEHGVITGENYSVRYIL